MQTTTNINPETPSTTGILLWDRTKPAPRKITERKAATITTGFCFDRRWARERVKAGKTRLAIDLGLAIIEIDRTETRFVN